MHSTPQASSDWDEDDEPILASPPGAALILAGLPASWRHYKWWLAGIAFSILWIADGWTSGGSLPGMEGVRHLTRSLWGLLVTLALCYGIFHFCKHRFGKLGFVLSILVAAAALARYGL